MKKTIVKIVIGAISAVILAIGGKVAYTAIATHIGMTQEHGEETGSKLFENYFKKGREYLKKL